MKEVVMIVTDLGGFFRTEREAKNALEKILQTQLAAVAHKLVHCHKFTEIKDELLRNIDVLASVARIRNELDRGVERLNE